MKQPFNPYLILRLRKPYEPIPTEVPASAVGFYLLPKPEQGQVVTSNDGRSKYINNALTCDYMGSAEFEFGSIPEALRMMAALAANGTLVERQITLVGKPEVAISPLPEVYNKESTRECTLLCRADQEDEVRKLLIELASNGNYPENRRFKEPPYIRRGLFGYLRNYRHAAKTMEENEFIGWMDLTNHWFLTSSKEQLAALKILLGWKEKQ